MKKRQLLLVAANERTLSSVIIDGSQAIEIPPALAIILPIMPSRMSVSSDIQERASEFPRDVAGAIVMDTFVEFATKGPIQAPDHVAYRPTDYVTTNDLSECSFVFHIELWFERE